MRKQKVSSAVIRRLPRYYRHLTDLHLAGVVLTLSALGHANLWQAAFADVGVSVIAILNAMRAMREPRKF